MDGIVLELQREALIHDTDVVTLLRKAFLIARKLKLSDFENWISKELNGYSHEDNHPSYRKFTGQLKAWNPINGWIPVIISSKEVYNEICIQYLSNPISNLASFLKENSKLHFPFNDNVNTMLSSMTNSPLLTKYALYVGNNIIDTIIESVKTKVLEWALLLEENNILGNGLTFTNEEKDAATHNPHITNYTINFFDKALDIQFQQGTD